MAKTQWLLLLTTCIVSCGSVAILIVSYLTNNWIVAEAWHLEANRNSQISYGLFSGSLTRYLLLTQGNYQLTMVCLFDEQACMYSCQQSQAAREDELRRILQRSTLLDCPTYTARHTKTISYSKYLNGTENAVAIPVNIAQRADAPTSDQVLDAGVYVSTLVFLSAALAFSVISALMALVNILLNPVAPILSVLGLYIWNVIAAGSTLITLVIWGVLYGSGLSENVAITDTLTTGVFYSSQGLANLGFSYWILILPLLMHGANIVLLFWRKRIIEAEPPPPTITVDKNDSTPIHFY